MKRNLPCELHVGGETHPAITVEIDECSIRVQCDAILAGGTDVDLRIPPLPEIAELWVKTRVELAPLPGEITLSIVEAPPLYEVLTMPDLRIAVPEPAPPAPAAGCEAQPIVLLDAGDLDPVARVFERLGLRYARVRVREGRVGPWPSPQQLLVASAQLAVALPLPALEEKQVVGIAIAGDPSPTLVRHAQRLGFRYLVNLPFQEDAFAVLVHQALYREEERRAVRRCAMGIQISWRTALRPRSATLIEISEAGGRLHCATPAVEGSVLRLHIPGDAGTGHAVELRGRVVRLEHRNEPGLAEPYVLGIAWEALDAQEVARLHELLQVRALGPVPLAASDAPEPGPLQQEPHAPADDAANQERRGGQRGLLEGEVISLTNRNSVEHLLVCRNLSQSGMQVEPHPSLIVGQRLRVALLDPGNASPIVLAAEVVRDAADGLGLRFFDVAPDVSQRLLERVEQLPAVQALQPCARPVVFGRLVDE